MFVGAEVVSCNIFYPGCIEASGRTGFSAVFDGVLHHGRKSSTGADNAYAPFLVDGRNLCQLELLAAVQSLQYVGVPSGKEMIQSCKR